MKWFIALTEETPFLENYFQMVKVAVNSARRFTQLDPVFIFDGARCPMTDWLERKGVEVITRRTSFYPRLQELAATTGNREFISFGAGVYLRMEIPTICAERGWDRGAVLYTDCDIMFVGDPEPLLPRFDGNFFAMGPESDRDDPEDINSGVMLMNLPALRPMDAPFKAFVAEHLVPLAMGTWVIQGCWDQPAYRYFFRHGWAALPPELNWKPYWGINEQARVIHFHGPKPFAHSVAPASAIHPLLNRLVTPGFHHYAQLWTAALREAELD